MAAFAIRGKGRKNERKYDDRAGRDLYACHRVAGHNCSILHDLDMDTASSGQQLPVDRALHPGCSDIIHDDSGRDDQHHEPSKT
jgi:hypothetical protein